MGAVVAPNLHVGVYDMLAFEMISDPSIQAKFKALAPNAAPGSDEAKAAFDKATADLDFDSSDGTPADTFDGKSLDPGNGGRANFLKAKLAVAGIGEEDAQNITGGHFTNVVKAWSTEQGIGDIPLGQKFAAWRDAHGVESRTGASTTTT